MKKISLKRLNLHEVEQLSRAQLKDVLGGLNDGGVMSVKCKESCLGWSNSGWHTVRGTCSTSTTSMGLTLCICSVTPISGSGSDCY